MTPAATQCLVPHPRLVVGARAQRLRSTESYPLMADDLARVRREAAVYEASVIWAQDMTVHNAHLLRARTMQRRVLTLLAHWTIEGDLRSRRAALSHLRQMDRWSHWSWIAWRAGDARPDALFDLSYGENAATLAFAWDWLQPTMTAAERAMMLAMARTRPFAAFQRGDHDGTHWWFGKTDSNWNAVCAGGLGLLALALGEAAPEAQALLARVETSMAPYLRHLHACGGGWPEGIGYWGYGMRYAFLYLLSWEQATGRRHPLLGLSGVRRTAAFPLDFCPGGAFASFGDVNRYAVHPFHYALAERCGRWDLVDGLDKLRAAQASAGDGQGWPAAVEALLFHPRRVPRHRGVARRVVRHYPKLDWYVLADRWPDPALALTIRGGTTEVPHGHLDLTSFHAVVGDEALLVNLGPTEYLDTTFSPRRWDLHEMVPASKNVMLINGAGIGRPSRVVSQTLNLGGFPAVRLDATAALGAARGEAPVRFAGRLFVLFDHRAALVLDRVVLRHFGRGEARLHTYGTVRAGEAEARIRGQRRRLALAFAADVPCVLRTATDPLTSPGPEARMLRWQTRDLHREMTLATLLTPGADPGRVSLSRDPRGRLVVTVRAAGLRHHLRLTPRLRG